MSALALTAGVEVPIVSTLSFGGAVLQGHLWGLGPSGLGLQCLALMVLRTWLVPR